MVVFQLSDNVFVIFNRYCFSICFLTLLIIIFINQMIHKTENLQIYSCNRNQIQEYFMNNLSIYDLMKKEPSRLNFFQYEINNTDICRKDDIDIDLLIVIYSQSESFEKRQAIRRTYGNLENLYNYLDDSLRKLNIRLLFMINFDEIRLKTIQFEQNLFHDIVHIKTPESQIFDIYRDFTLFDWTSKYCPQARFLFKIEDSIFINPFLLLKFISQNQNDRFDIEPKTSLNINNCRNLHIHLPYIYGFIDSNRSNIPCKIYPKYLNKNLYLISKDVRDLFLCTFHRQSNELSFQAHIYLTGFLSEYLNIERQTLGDYQMNDASKSTCEQFFSQTKSSQAFACVYSNDKHDNFLSSSYTAYWQLISNSQMNPR